MQLFTCSRNVAHGSVHYLSVDARGSSRTSPVPSEKLDWIHERMQGYYGTLKGIESVVFVIEPVQRRPFVAIRHTCHLGKQQMEVVTTDQDVTFTVSGITKSAGAGSYIHRACTLKVKPVMGINQVSLEIKENQIHPDGRFANKEHQVIKGGEARSLNVPEKFNIQRAIGTLVDEIPKDAGKYFLKGDEFARAASMAIKTIGAASRQHLNEYSIKAVDRVSSSLSISGGARRS